MNCENCGKSINEVEDHDDCGKQLPTAALDELTEKFEERIDKWSDSYDPKTGYTQGKIVGAYNALSIFKDMKEELVQDLGSKFKCGFCNHQFYSKLDDPRCPGCGQANWQCYSGNFKVKKSIEEEVFSEK